MTIHHHADAEIFARFALTVLAKLGHRTERRGFGSLAASIRVTLGIEHQDIDVLGQAHHMIEAAKANIVSPAIAANQPDRLLDQRIGIGQQLLRAFHITQCTAQGRYLIAAQLWRGIGTQVGKQIGGQRVRKLLHQAHNALAMLVNAQAEAKPELSVIFKQRVGPRRPAPVGIGGVGG